MKRIFALALAVMMLCVVFGAQAEEKGEPLFATVGDALAAAGERPVAGSEDNYYAVVTEKDGKYYRSVAELDDRAKELQQAVWEADADNMEEAFAAEDEYIRTLPVAWSEEFTAVPMAQADMDALAGKTIGDLREAGYEDRESGTEGEEIVYVMRGGMFDYACAVDADADAYEQAQEEYPDGGKDFVIRSVKLRGVTDEAYSQRFHTDGTVEELPDLFANFSALAADVQEMIARVQNGEEIDADEFFNSLKERYPDLADSIGMYLDMYKLLGAEGLSAMFSPVE